MKRWLLNALYVSAVLLALPWLLWRSFRTGRYRSGLKEKLLGCVDGNPVVRAAGKTEDPLSSGPYSNSSRDGCDDIFLTRPVVWLHGVSVGEVQLLLQLLKRLSARLPEVDFAFSTTTESGMKLASEQLSVWARNRPSELSPDAQISLFFQPLDFSWAIRRAFHRIKPSLVVLGELELWPNWIDETVRSDVPMMVVNGRLSQKSFQGYHKLSWATKSMFRKLTRVAAQSETYARRFIDCGVDENRVSVTGSLKFDNVAFDRSRDEVQQLRELSGVKDSDTIWVVGSTQDPEEEAAVEAFIRARDSYPNLRLIVVPRHPDRFASVRTAIEKQDVRLAVRSQLSRRFSVEDCENASVPGDGAEGSKAEVQAHPTAEHAEDWEVLLVDTVGELRWWWGLANLALVGGSFGSRGGQNMIEPAAFGANVAFGPNTSNFKDVTELLLSEEASRRITDLNSIESWLSEELADLEVGIRRGQRAIGVVADQQGATSRTIDLIEQELKKKCPRSDLASSQTLSDVSDAA